MFVSVSIGQTHLSFGQTYFVSFVQTYLSLYPLGKHICLCIFLANILVFISFEQTFVSVSFGQTHLPVCLLHRHVCAYIIGFLCDYI